MSSLIDKREHINGISQIRSEIREDSSSPSFVDKQRVSASPSSPSSNNDGFVSTDGVMPSLPSWSVEAAAVALLTGYFFSTKLCTTFTLAYLFVRAYLSDFGQRSIKTMSRDFTGIALLIKINWIMRPAMRKDAPIHRHFLSVVARHPSKECITERNYKKDDVIALFLENGIEFFASWLGLSKLGVISAWINTNLKLECLAYSIKVSNCKAIITSPTLLPKLNDAVSRGLLDPAGIRIFVANADEPVDGAETLRDMLTDDVEPAPTDKVTFHSILCYIYTSGTTGHPKAAIIRHYRYFLMALACGYAFGISRLDRIYVTLPMYHSAGGILGIGNVVVNGATAVVRTKFSASNFWKDCVRFQCTASQYIGEICRYLLAQKPSVEETAHRVRVMYGNGLRPQIWRDFVQRFRIKRVGELYGSTEGNSNILNLDNHEGSCGFIPIYPFLKRIYPIRLFKVDEDTGELIRDPRTGLCVPCVPGETGEMVGRINNDPILRFEGYVNSEETSKKVIRDVMQHGDQAFSSGDILHWDRLGYLYFKDRRGDTFRWKGENCATTEVEGVVQPLHEIIDATVYGVEVPHCEGRAGMMAISLANEIDQDKFFDKLARRLNDNLASYAIPLFLRICKHVDRTGTFKLKKSDLRKESFDPAKCDGDPLYYWDALTKAYASLDEHTFEAIKSGAYTRL